MIRQSEREHLEAKGAAASARQSGYDIIESKVCVESMVVQIGFLEVAWTLAKPAEQSASVLGCHHVEKKTREELEKSKAH
jgi:hypothetical protein